ncbi:MAG: hypothetical protein QW478_07450 [Candidatus Micrarchaeaceae archaeon]
MNEAKNQILNVKVVYGDAAPAGWIAYSIATWMAWASLCSFVTPKAYLLMAAVSLACTIPYLVAGFSELKAGNIAGGSTWVYFGTFFAFASSLTYAIEYFAPIYHLELDYRILGFEWIILALVLIFTTPVFLKFAPFTASISIIGADIGLLTLALIYWNIGDLSLISGWAFFVAGLFGVLMAIGGILNSAGINFPIGKPLLKLK